jgi:5-hydroxyisourate hydrolase-like protein (transthyretin family)
VKRLWAPVFLLLAFLSLPLQAAKVSITGRILDPEGKPAANIKVALIPILPEVESARLELAGKTGPEPAAITSTDAAGIFHLVAPDAGMWRAQVEAPGFVPLEYPLTPLLDETDLPDARLLPDAGLQARVTDPRGQPLARAWVRVEGTRTRWPFPAAWRLPLRRVAFTDANGSATLPRTREEALTVRAAAPGYLPAEQKNIRGGSAALRLGAGRSRQVLVRDSKGKGVADAFVAWSESASWAGRTAESGLLDLIVPENGVELRITVADGRQLLSRLRAAKPDEKGPAVLVLPQAEPVSGKIVSALDGRPVAGALAWTGEDYGAAVRAGADGTFRLPNFQKEAGVTAAAPGFFPEDGQASGGRLPTFSLQPRLAASGVVVDEAGRPVAGASLVASFLPDRLRGIKGYTAYRSGGFARSATSGRFRLSGLLAGIAYELRIGREGFAPARMELPVREAGKPAPDLRIVLRAGRTLFGSVIDGGRRPVAGARVSLRPAAPTSLQARLSAAQFSNQTARSLEVPTDAAGRFEIKNLVAGAFDLTVRARGFAPLTVPALAVPEGKGATDAGTVMLAPGASIRGRVADPKGNPIDGAEVYGKSRDELRRSLGEDPEPADAVTAADGSFVLEDRPPGVPLDLTVIHPGYGPGSALGVAVPSEAAIRIVLLPIARVAGRTLDPDGRPVAGASVFLSEQESRSFGGRSALMSSDRFHRGTSDDEGGFSFDGVSPGTFGLSAQAPHRQQAELKNMELKGGQDLTGVELVLPPASEVTGRVLSPEGRPVAEAQVVLVEASEERYPAFSSLRAATDADGQYRIDGLPPGKRTLEARAEGYRRTVRDVELTAAATVVDFTLERGLEASGRVVDDAGNPIAGVDLTLFASQYSADAPHAVSEADGTFRFSGLRDGTYRLIAFKDGYAPDRRGTKVMLAGAPVSGLEVKLSWGGTITGRLTGVEFSQLSRVQVSANFMGSGQVDAEGVYRIPHLPPGRWTVKAVVPDTSLQAEGVVNLEPGVSEVRLDLQLGGGRTLTGVVLSNGEPLAGAMLLLVKPRTLTRQIAASDHQGGFRFGGLEEGVYDLDVSTPKGALHHESVEISGDREIQVELRTASLSGRVIDATDSSPVSGVRISLRSQREGSLTPFEDATTDARGAFRLLEVGDGAWTVRAARDGYAPAEREVRVDGSPESLEIRLEPTEGMTVEALLPTGQAPDRLQVAALDAGGKVVASGSYPTGENGRTRLSNVPPGSWQLVLGSDASASVTVPVTVPGPVVRALLPPAGRLRIKVAALASGEVAAKVTLTGTGGLYSGFDWDGSVMSAWELEGGAVVLPQVPTGVWQLTARATDGRSWSGTATVTPGGVAEVVLK